MSDKAKIPRSLVLILMAGQVWVVSCHLYEYHYVEDSKTWTDAQKHCRDKHTDLATVSSMEDMERLNDSAKNGHKPAWIGLYDQTGVNGTWYWSLPGLDFNDSETNWHESEPNNSGGKERCGAVRKTLKWLDVSCNKKNEFLCFNESKTEGFVFINNEMTWFEARRHCREEHTDLVSGLRQLNDPRLKDLAKTCCESWGDAFIGLFRDTWRWSDGSSFSFRLWERLPNGKTNRDQCAVMKEDGEWETDDCDKTKPFICYKDKVVLVQQKKTWEEALYHCRDNYRDLVSITNLDEQRWVQEKVRNATTDLVWMGLRYTCTLDFWFWVTDEVVSYKNWDSGEEGDGCDLSGAMKKSGGHKWSKRNDMEKLNFLCSER